MATYRSNRIIPIILVIIIVIIAITALVSLARAVFFSGNSSQDSSVVDVSRDALLNTSDAHSVRAVVRGPIVADEDFQSYQMTISPSSRNLTTYKGYLDSVVDQINLGNNTAAYEQFVYALDKANLSRGTQLEGDKNDIRGVCASGNVYEFSILDGGESVKTLWTSTCSGSKGSLNASVDQLMTLFGDQIPGSSTTIRNVGL